MPVPTLAHELVVGIAVRLGKLGILVLYCGANHAPQTERAENCNDRDSDVEVLFHGKPPSDDLTCILYHI